LTSFSSPHKPTQDFQTPATGPSGLATAGVSAGGHRVLAPADRLAEAAIRRAATQAFAINAVSPTGLLDTLLFAARAMRLIRRVAWS
jgi:hypothetical protein